jgi:nucleotide-binding universal stress UspA family protein
MFNIDPDLLRVKQNSLEKATICQNRSTAINRNEGGRNMYKKVLVPLDGSDLAECTLSQLKSLFKDESSGEVTLLNIVKVDIPWAEMHDEKPFDINELRKPLFAASKNYLAKVASQLSSQGIKVKTESMEANRPADTITEYARKNGMDLIVMATHGHTGFKKLMLGSVAFGVLHESHVPVLLIRPEACRL